MLHIDIMDKEREGRELFRKFDIAVYAKKTFGMFGGEECIVKLECDNSLIGVIIDRFGKNVNIVKVDDEHFAVSVRVAVSRQFLSWVISLGEGIKITGPGNVLEQIREEIKRLNRQYME